MIVLEKEKNVNESLTTDIIPVIYNYFYENVIEWH